MKELKKGGGEPDEHERKVRERLLVETNKGTEFCIQVNERR